MPINTRKTIMIPCRQIRRSVAPSALFLFLIITFIVLPAFWVYEFKFYENLWVQLSFDNYDSAALLNCINVSLAFFCICFGLILFKLMLKVKIKKGLFCVERWEIAGKNIGSIIIRRGNQFELVPGYRFIYVLGIVSILCIAGYLSTGGYKKVFLLGTDMSMQDFRLTGSFEEGGRFFKAFLQIARRVFIPFILVYLTIYRWYDPEKGKIYTRIIWLTFIVSILSTLDRAPLLMAAILVFYTILISSPKVGKLFFIVIPVSIAVLIVLGGVMTFVQHNLINFSVWDVILNGFRFLWYRVLLAPTIVAIEESFSIFPVGSEKLFLEFSRLGALIGGGYVGTTDVSSIYVSPVGFVGDIWRNFGSEGIIFCSFFLGIYLAWLDFLSEKSSAIMRVTLGFSVITFSFYLSHGVFFSQGVFFQAIFMAMIGLRFTRRRMIPKLICKKVKNTPLL